MFFYFLTHRVFKIEVAWATVLTQRGHNLFNSLMWLMPDFDQKEKTIYIKHIGCTFTSHSRREAINRTISVKSQFLIVSNGRILW